LKLAGLLKKGDGKLLDFFQFFVESRDELKGNGSLIWLESFVNYLEHQKL